VRLSGWIGLGLVAFAVFENSLRMDLVSAVRALHGPDYQTAVAFWALEELVWWSLVTGLMGAMLLIVWDSPTGVWARHLALSRLAVFSMPRSVRWSRR
jgi:hypothetical protein